MADELAPLMNFLKPSVLGAATGFEFQPVDGILAGVVELLFDGRIVPDPGVDREPRHLGHHRRVSYDAALRERSKELRLCNRRARLRHWFGPRAVPSVFRRRRGRD